MDIEHEDVQHWHENAGEDLLEVLSQTSGQQSSFNSTSEDGEDTLCRPETWSESIDNVLADPEGDALLEEFLHPLRFSNYRLFHLAVKGWKEGEGKLSAEKRRTLPYTIYNVFIKEDGMLRGALKADTRDQLVSTFQPLRFMVDPVSSSVYDQAYREVYEHLQNYVLPLFIQSDLYINFLNNHTYENQHYVADDEVEDNSHADGGDSVKNYASEEINQPPSPPPPFSIPLSNQISNWSAYAPRGVAQTGGMARDDSGVFADSPQTPQLPSSNGFLTSVGGHSRLPMPNYGYLQPRVPDIPVRAEPSKRPTLPTKPTTMTNPVSNSADSTVKELTRSNLQSHLTALSLKEPTGKSKVGDIYPKPLPGHLAYASFLPPSQQVSASEVDTRVSSSSVGPPRGERLSRPQDLNFRTAHNAAALNLEPHVIGRKVPKMPNELQQGERAQNPQDFVDRVSQRLLEEQNRTGGAVEPRVVQANREMEQAEAESTQIMNAKLQELRVNEESASRDSWGSPAGSPVPPPRGPLTKLLSANDQAPRFLPSFAPRPSLLQQPTQPFASRSYSQTSTQPASSDTMRTPGQIIFPHDSMESRNQMAPQRHVMDTGAGQAPGGGLYRGPNNPPTVVPLASLPYQNLSAVTAVSDDTGFVSMQSRPTNRATVSQRNAALTQAQQQTRRTLPSGTPYLQAPELSSTQARHGTSGQSHSQQMSSTRAPHRNAPSRGRTNSRHAVPRLAEDDSVSVFYSYGREGSQVFMSKITGGRDLRTLKEKILSKDELKKNKFKFFLKVPSTQVSSGFILQEISDDDQILPLFEGNITAVLMDS